MPKIPDNVLRIPQDPLRGVDPNIIAIAEYEQLKIDEAFSPHSKEQSEALKRALGYATAKGLKGTFSFEGETYSTDGNAIDFASEKQIIDQSRRK